MACRALLEQLCSDASFSSRLFFSQHCACETHKSCLGGILASSHGSLVPKRGTGIGLSLPVL